MLRDHPASLHQLAGSLGTDTKDLEADLQHLLRSIRNSPYRAVITPARCRKCGFMFQREKLRKPGRCPACRSSWISEPVIGIEERR